MPGRGGTRDALDGSAGIQKGAGRGTRGPRCAPRHGRAGGRRNVVRRHPAVGRRPVVAQFAGLLAVDPGFRAEGVLTERIALPAARYASVEVRAAFYDRAFSSLRALPGVRDAGAAVVVPLTGNNWTAGLERADQPVVAGERPPEVGWQLASGGCFQALRIPLLSGRLFGPTDGPDAPPVVIISDAVERRYFPDGPRSGRRHRCWAAAEIVGVVGDIRRAGLTTNPDPTCTSRSSRGPTMGRPCSSVRRRMPPCRPPC